MPVSHSQKFLCVFVRPSRSTRTRDGLDGIRHVPELVARIAERAKQIGLALVGSREVPATAHTRHLRAPGLPLARVSRNVREVSRPLRIRHVDDRCAVSFVHPGQRVPLNAPMVADIGNPAIPLVVDGRLIRASSLEIVVADQSHVALLGLVLSRGRRAESNPERQEGRIEASHDRCLLLHLARSGGLGGSGGGGSIRRCSIDFSWLSQNDSSSSVSAW